MGLADILRLRDEAPLLTLKKDVLEAEAKKAKLEIQQAERFQQWREMNPWASNLDDKTAQTLALYQLLNPSAAPAPNPQMRTTGNGFVVDSELGQDPRQLQPPSLDESVRNQMFGINPQENAIAKVLTGDMGGGPTAASDASPSVGGLAADMTVRGLKNKFLGTPMPATTIRGGLAKEGEPGNKYSAPVTYDPVTGKTTIGDMFAEAQDLTNYDVSEKGRKYRVWADPNTGKEVRRVELGLDTSLPENQPIGVQGAQFYVDAAGGEIPGLTPNSTQGEAEKLYMAFMAGKGEGARGRPSLPTGPSAKGPKGGPQIIPPPPALPAGFRTTGQKAAEEAAGREAATLGVRNASGQVSAEEMERYSMADGTPISGRLSPDELKAGLSSGMYRALGSTDKAVAGESAGKLQAAIGAMSRVQEIRALLTNPDGSLNRKIIMQAAAPGGGIGEGRRLNQLGFDAIDGLWRARTGAAITPTEAADYKRTFLPSLMSNDETVLKGLNMLEQNVKELATTLDPTGGWRKKMGVAPLAATKGAPVWNGKAWVTGEGQ